MHNPPPATHAAARDNPRSNQRRWITWRLRKARTQKESGLAEKSKGWGGGGGVHKGLLAGSLRLRAGGFENRELPCAAPAESPEMRLREVVTLH